MYFYFTQVLHAYQFLSYEERYYFIALIPFVTLHVLVSPQTISYGEGFGLDIPQHPFYIVTLNTPHFHTS